MACADYIIHVDNNDDGDFQVTKALIGLVKKFDGTVKKEYGKAHKLYVKVPAEMGDTFKGAVDEMGLEKGLKVHAEPDRPAHTL